MTKCLEWKGVTFSGGYGRIGSKRAHRVVWEQAHGPIPAGLFVCHRCDNPRCIRLSHLFLGTPADNMRDRDAKGRSYRGTRVWTNKLNPTTVKELRARFGHLRRGRGVHRTPSDIEIGREYGVSGVMIGMILGGKSWRWLH